MLNELQWLGLADRKAGVVDDLVLGLSGKVVGHQFKTSLYPARFNVSTLLLGAEKNLQKLASSWQELRSQFPGSTVEIRFITTDYAHDSDHLLGKDAAHDHSAAFIAELRDNPDRPLADWQASKWWPFVEKLEAASGLNSLQFEAFIQSFRLVCGPEASFLANLQSEQAERGIREIAQLIPRLIAQRGAKDRWTSDEFLTELKWPDDRGRRHSHKFPIGAHVQRNLTTENLLLESISARLCFSTRPSRLREIDSNSGRSCVDNRTHRHPLLRVRPWRGSWSRSSRSRRFSVSPHQRAAQERPPSLARLRCRPPPNARTSSTPD